MAIGDTTPSRIALLVEDEAPIRTLLRLHLELADFKLDEAADGRDGLERARMTQYALIVLDVMLPGLDGVTVCRAIRASGANVDTPILMLTARDAEADKVIGLESGADDYLTKPFGVRELMARIGALLRRHGRESAASQASGPISTAQIAIDHERRLVTVRGEPVELTRQEFDLLHLLVRRSS